MPHLPRTNLSHIVQKESIKQEYHSWNTTRGLPHSTCAQLVSLGFFICRLEGSHCLHDMLQSGVLASFRSQWTLPHVPHYVRKLKHNFGWDQVLSGPTVGAKCSCQLTWSSVDFEDKLWLHLSLVDSVLPFGCWNAAPLRQKGSYLLIALRRSSQYRAYRNNK